ncbi:MAG: T9SS type A sorting domain-containing protein [Chitinophagaceae bacterium]|nr:T9SS type A sorting domain-containing protein [Chitinophagaceae bacterium]
MKQLHKACKNIKPFGALKNLFLAGLLTAGALTGAQAQSIPGLYSKYCLDGNALDSWGPRNGTVMGAVPAVGHTGIPNTALQFNGVSDYVDLPADVWVAGDFSVSGWIYMDSHGYWERMFEFGNGIDMDNVFYAMTNYTIQPTLGLHQCSSTARDYHTGATALTLGSWEHIVVTLSGTNVTVYRNGTVWYTSVTAYPPCSVLRTLCYFGRSIYSNNTYFHGRLDDILIFDRAITPANVTTLYTGNQGCQYITARVTSGIEDIAVTASEQKAALAQNMPNPFVRSTEIHYQLPKFAQSASIEVMDITGRLVKHIDVPVQGSGSVTLENSNFMPGIYTYTLMVDGKASERRKMTVNAQ